MSQAMSQQYTITARFLSSTDDASASIRRRGRLIAPGRCSSAYSSAGSTSTSCAPASTMRRSPSRSISFGISTSRLYDVSDHVGPVCCSQIRGFIQIHDSARHAALVSPPVCLLGVGEQVAVGTPLFVNVLAAAHQLFVRPEEDRIVAHRTTALEVNRNRPCTGAR